jgi:hypothetical protein
MASNGSRWLLARTKLCQGQDLSAVEPLSSQTGCFRLIRKFETVRTAAMISRMYTPEMSNNSPSNHKKINTSTIGQSIQLPVG